jgi:hypothetical protein
MEMDDLLEKFLDQENLHRTEGRKGVENLCKLVNTLGYKDRMYFGQLSNSCCIGDLIDFLEDNSGCIEAIYNWIGEQKVPEWKEKLQSEIEEEEEEELEEETADGS